MSVNISTKNSTCLATLENSHYLSPVGFQKSSSKKGKWQQAKSCGFFPKKKHQLMAFFTVQTYSVSEVSCCLRNPILVSTYPTPDRKNHQNTFSKKLTSRFPVCCTDQWIHRSRNRRDKCNHAV